MDLSLTKTLSFFLIISHIKCKINIMRYIYIYIYIWKGLLFRHTTIMIHIRFYVMMIYYMTNLRKDLTFTIHIMFYY